MDSEHVTRIEPVGVAFAAIGTLERFHDDAGRNCTLRRSFTKMMGQMRSRYDFFGNAGRPRGGRGAGIETELF